MIKFGLIILMLSYAAMVNSQCDSYGRGVGVPISSCPSGYDKIDLLCYLSCRSGYYAVGLFCWSIMGNKIKFSY